MMRSEAVPQSSAEQNALGSIIEVFKSVLDTQEVDADTDFFMAGGNSVMAARAVARIRKASGARISMRDVLFGRTPRSLAVTVTGQQEGGR
jgi:hypothetical protein